MEESSEVKARMTRLEKALEHEHAKYILYGRTNYSLQQALVWASLLASAAAGLIGLMNLQVPKPWIGGLAAASAGLVAAGGQLGFQQKANWHYRKAEAITALLRRLRFELPVAPDVDDVATVSKGWSNLDATMGKQWEDMQPQPPSAKH